MAEQSGAKVFNPPNTLKAKVGPMPPSAEDLRAVKKADAVIANLAGKYLEVVDQDLASLNEAAAKFRDDPAGRAQHLKRVFHIAHDMRGQGGSFGYPLVTQICDHLCRFIDRTADFGEGEIQVLNVHLDALNLVIRQKMQKADTQQAQALLKGLELVHAKRAK